MAGEVGGALLLVAIEETPAIISLIRAAFVRKHPDQPQPTSEEVIAAYHKVVHESLDRDAQLLEEYPPSHNGDDDGA